MDKKCCHEPLNENQIKEMLTKNGLNRTKVKIQILQAISKSHRPLSIIQIHSLIKEDCDVSTVFRSITQFKEKNLVLEVNLEEGFLRYRMNSADNAHDNHHHHHVRCRTCGDIQNIDRCDLSAFEKVISRLGFKNMEHRLEFSAICSNCSKS